MEQDERSTVTLHYASPDEGFAWHDGPGWYYVIDEYPDEGSCGAFATCREAREHAERDGYRVNPIL